MSDIYKSFHCYVDTMLFRFSFYTSLYNLYIAIAKVSQHIWHVGRCLENSSQTENIFEQEKNINLSEMINIQLATAI